MDKSGVPFGTLFAFVRVQPVRTVPAFAAGTIYTNREYGTQEGGAVRRDGGGGTLVEYIAGLISIKLLHVKLWDYSKQWGNIQGIICPKFTLGWAVLSAVYYFLIHPRIENALVWLSNNLAFSFIIGFFYGVFVIDLVNATALLVKIKRFADEKQIVVKYEQLREHIRVNREKRLEKAKFLMSMGPQSAMAEQLKQYYDKFRDELERSKKDARKTDGGDEK